MLIGTVRGNIHDFGKNLVAMTVEGTDSEVVDIGINNAVEDYFVALKEHQPTSCGAKLTRYSGERVRFRPRVGA
jgi:5-methyltetrahydrofolate--homocysteine methyltransferase